MGLFGKSKEIIPCKVWKTRVEQLKGMSTEAMRAVTSGSDAMIIPFFEDRFQECVNFFQQTGIPFVDANGGFPSQHAPSIYLVIAGKIEMLATSALNTPVILFNGLHPLPEREEKIAAKFSNAKSKQRFASLEDPLFKAFGMENVATLMETLGMQNGECIEHKFVDKAISSAQEKLGAKVRTEVLTQSEEDWFKRNLIK